MKTTSGSNSTPVATASAVSSSDYSALADSSASAVSKGDAGTAGVPAANQAPGQQPGQPRPNRRIAGLTVLAPIAWGTTYVTITELLPPDRPLLVAGLRVLPAGLVLAGFGYLRSGWRPRGEEWRHTAILSLFNAGLFFPLLIVAIYRLPGGVAAAVGGIQPLLVLMLSWIIAGRRPAALELFAGTLAVIGVGLVVVQPGAGVDLVGTLAAVAANLSFSLGVVLTKRLPSPASQIGSTGWQLLVSSVLIVPLAFVFEGAPPSMDAKNLVGFAYLSLVATGGAFALWFNGIRKLPVVAPPLLGLAAPTTGALMGWALLGQGLSITQLGGFALTLVAIAYGASARTANVS